MIAKGKVKAKGKAKAKDKGKGKDEEKEKVSVYVYKSDKEKINEIGIIDLSVLLRSLLHRFNEYHYNKFKNILETTTKRINIKNK